MTVRAIARRVASMLGGAASGLEGLLGRLGRDRATPAKPPHE